MKIRPRNAEKFAFEVHKSAQILASRCNAFQLQHTSSPWQSFPYIASWKTDQISDVWRKLRHTASFTAQYVIHEYSNFDLCINYTHWIRDKNDKPPLHICWFEIDVVRTIFFFEQCISFKVFRLKRKKIICFDFCMKSFFARTNKFCVLEATKNNFDRKKTWTKYPNIQKSNT